MFSFFRTIIDIINLLITSFASFIDFVLSFVGFASNLQVWAALPIVNLAFVVCTIGIALLVLGRH